MRAPAKTSVLAVLAAAACAIVWFTEIEPKGREVQAEASLAARPAGLSAGRLAEASHADTESAPAESMGGAAERITLDVPQLGLSPPVASWEEVFDAGAVYGTITDDAAQPIAGARVALYPRRGEYAELGAPIAECLSNAEGRFRFQDCGEFESYRVYAEADGYMPSFPVRSTGIDEEIVLQRSAPFAGRVIDAATRAPLAGVTVSIGSVIQSGAKIEGRVSCVTDEEGRYKIPCARVDRVESVTVLRPGGFPEQREFQVQREKPDGYDIELRSGPALELYVYDAETGKPVAGELMRLAQGLEARTDERGMVRIAAPDPSRLTNGKLMLDVRVDGWCRTSRTITVEDSLADPIEVPLVRGARITGVVMNADGEPIEDAAIWVQNGNRKLETVRLPDGAFIQNNSKEARTDAAGRFEVAAVLPGAKEIKVTASAPDYLRKTSNPLYLPSSATGAQVELELDRGALVHGKVTLNGEPVYAKISCYQNEMVLVGQSNDSGAYRLRGVAAGMARLQAEVGRRFATGMEHSEELWVEDGAVVEHDIAIVKRRATIAGRVVDAAGTPVPGASVTGWAEDSEQGEWFQADDKSGADGSFELAVDERPGLLYHLSVHSGQRSATLANVAIGTQNVELVLPRCGKLRLSVVDRVSRSPVGRFSLYWRPEGESSFQSLYQGSRELSPGPDGLFEAELPVGAVDLRVTARSQNYTPADVLNVAIAEEETAEAFFELEHGVKLELHFVSATPGVRLPRVMIVSESQADELKRSRWSSYASREIHNAQRVVPNAEGRASLSALAPGEYTFFEPPKGYAFEPAEFEVPAVDVHTVEIRWRFEPEDGGGGKGELKAALQGLGYVGSDG